MSIIASTYNTGTGLSSSVAEEQLPVVVNDLTVNGNLTVIESTILNGPTTITTDLIVGDTTTTNNLIVNNNSILDNGVGQNNTSLFKLPLTNGTTDQILTISDDTTNPILTEWKDAPLSVNDYVQYDTVNEKIRRNFDLVITDINNLVLNGKIGKSVASKFQLPANPAITAGNVLTIIDGATNETGWLAPIITDDFVRYNTDSYKLKKVVSSVEYDINKLSLNDSIGLNNLQQFKLPSNTSTSGNGFKLTIIDQTTTPMTTAWTSQYYANNFLRSNAETFRLLSVIDQVETIVNDLTIDGKIGKIDEGFQLPTNSSTADAQSVLTLFNATTKSTLWQKPYATVAYDASTFTLSSNDPSIVDITDLTLNGQIGKTSQRFSFPSNTSTAPSDSMLHITTSGLRTTIWKSPFANVAYDGSSYKFSTNNPSIVDISNISLDGQIGKTSQLFSLPSNTSTAPASSVLTLSNSTTRTTTWTTIPNITDYVRYNPSLYELSRVLNGTPTTITSLTVNFAIGRSTAQRFGLPTNCSTAPAGAVLAINVASGTAPSTIWTTIPNITNYTNYDSTAKTLISNVSGTPTTVSDLVMSGSVGSSTAEKFVLPSNSSTATLNSVLTLSNTTTKATTWTTIPNITDYVRYNPSLYELSRVLNGTPTTITSLTVNVAIGRSTAQRFGLPTNCSTAPAGAVLAINVASGTAPSTIWKTIPNITNYTNYDSTAKTLISNVSGTPTTVSDLVMSGSVGSSTAEKFVLPSNSSTATLNSVLTLSNTTTKATTWVSPTSLINNYVNYNSLNNKLANVISGTATDITTVVVNNIGKESQTFVLPSNTSTATAGSVLRLNNATTKTTDWVVPAMIPTTTETSITTAVATATAATVEMCRASNLTAGTYLITYYVDLNITTTTRAFTYRSYGISTASGSLTAGGGIVGLCVGDSVPFTAPVITGTTPVRYIGSGVCVLTATTTLYLLVRFVYTGTTFNTKGTLRVTKLA